MTARRARIIALIVVGASLLAAWWTRPDRAAGPCAVAAGPTSLPDIPESSGLAVSRRRRACCGRTTTPGTPRLARRRIQIHRVPEPLPGDSATAPVETFVATYTDGPHNAEALFVLGPDLYIVTKDRVGGLYRAALPSPPGRALLFERIGELGLELVTDAELSRDGKAVVVRTPHEAVFYSAADVTGGRPGVALDGDVLFLSS